MKSAIAKSVALVALASPMAALAQQAAATSENAKTVIPYGLVVSYLRLADTTRANVPDFNSYRTRFGLKVTEGIARAQIETNLNGNIQGKDAVTYTRNGVILRRADVGVALETGTEIYLGRVRPGGAKTWGVDATYIMNQYSAMDGLLLKQVIEVEEGSSVSLIAGIGNHLGYPGSVSYEAGGFLANETFSQGYSKKQDKGYVVGIDASIIGVQGAFYYGAENNQTRKFSDDNPDSKIESGDKVADVSLIEAHLGYETEGIGGGIWLERDTIGRSRTVTGNEQGKLRVNQNFDPDSQKETTVNFGIGAFGDSSLFGLTDLIQTGDKIVYGLSFNRTQNTTGASSSAQRDKDFNRIALGGGYNIGGFTTELDLTYGFNTGRGRDFTNTKGEVVKKHATNLTLAGIYEF